MYECLPMYVSMDHTHAWHIWMPEDGVKFPESGVTGNCELSCGIGNQTQFLCKKQQVLSQQSLSYLQAHHAEMLEDDK